MSTLKLNLRLLAFVAILTPVILAILGESYVRLWCLPAIGSVLEHDPYKTLILNRAPRGISTPTTLSTNRWGMRGDEPPTDWSRWNSIIAIGSSTTLCYALDDHKTWPYLIQKNMASGNRLVWVGNAGQDGVTTASTVSFMDEVIRRIHPTTVLLLVGGSDAALSFSDRRRDNGSPYDRAFEKRLARERDKPSLKEHSSLFREYNLWKRRRSREITRLDQAAHVSFFPSPITASEDAISIDSIIHGPEAAFTSNILRIHALAKEIGTRDIYFTQPSAYGKDSLWAGLKSRSIQFHGHDYTISAATERHIQDRFNARLLSLCASNGLECVDLASLIPNDSTHFYDEGHFTEIGAALFAKKAADYLLSHPEGR